MIIMWGVWGSSKTPTFREEIHGLPSIGKFINKFVLLINNVQSY